MQTPFLWFADRRYVVHVVSFVALCFREMFHKDFHRSSERKGKKRKYGHLRKKESDSKENEDKKKLNDQDDWSRVEILDNRLELGNPIAGNEEGIVMKE